MLRPGGLFLLDDWGPDAAGAVRPDAGPGRDAPIASAPAGSACFPFHNRYTVEDWKWLLAEAGFSLVSTVQLRPQSQIFVAVTRTLPSGD